MTLILFIWLATSAECANILGVLIYPSYSHQVGPKEILKELSLRGHQVTVLTPNPSNDPTLTNLTEISFHFAYEAMQQNNALKMYSKELNAYDLATNAQKIVNIASELELDSAPFRQLLQDEKNHFDLILMQHLHPAFHALGHRFKAPVIVIYAGRMSTQSYDLFGLPNHPSLYSDFLLYFGETMTLWQKLQSLVFYIWCQYTYDSKILPEAHQMAKKYFGDDIPYVGDLEQNVSMVFVNTNQIIGRRPAVPSVIDISLSHVKKPKPLPEDLQEILDDATEGAIYLSFGTNVKTGGFDDKLTTNIFQALSQLPYKVLCKWDANHLPNLPPNVVIRRWFPQNDILAHPNVKVFVTQGGLQSIEEAVAREVPLLGIPFSWDQPKNVRRIVELGIGGELNVDGLTDYDLKNAIIRIATNQNYKEKIQEVRQFMVDRHMSGLESAVWWSEYVLRHRGTKYGRLPNGMFWSHLLLSDFVLLVCLVTLGFYSTCRLAKMLQILFQKT